MKRIPVLLALFCVGLLAASLAAAKAPPGKGKPEGKGKKTTSTSTKATDPETCKPKISVIIKGEFVSGGGSSFTIDVKQSNFHGRDLVGEPLTLMVDEKTSYRRNGHAELSDFKAGDRLNVQARACKKQKKQKGDSQAAAAAVAPAMLARRVTGHPAASDSEAASTTTTSP